MKAIFGLLILALSVIATQLSCKKSTTIDTPLRPKPPIQLDSMLLCHGQNNCDSTAIHHALIGKWQWVYISCYWNPESANNQDFKTLSVEFNQHDSLEVKLNGQTTQKSSWGLVRTNDGYFKLLANPIVLQLPGKVLFCGDFVLFYDSYVDGCDNYFKKQN
jgi:hypothetical protein